MAQNIVLSIKTMDVKSLRYNQMFSNPNGEPKKLDVKTTFGVKLNPEQPLSAVVGVRFVSAIEDGSMVFDMEVITLVTVNSFVDNLDEVIKKDFMATIMLAVNEKIKSVTGAIGLNLNITPVNFTL